MPGSNDIFQDPDFLALDDDGKTRVLNQIKAATGTMPAPQAQAVENPALGRNPGSTQDIGTDMRQAGALASIAGALLPRTAGLPSPRLASLVGRGTKEPIVGEPRQGAIDYARNQQINRANLTRTSGSSGTTGVSRPGPASGSVPLRAKVAGAASAEPAGSVTRPPSPTSSTIWTPETSAQNTGMWHAGQGNMPNPEVQTPQNLSLAARIRQLYGGGRVDPSEEAFRRELFNSMRTKLDPRGRGY